MRKAIRTCHSLDCSYLGGSVTFSRTGYDTLWAQVRSYLSTSRDRRDEVLQLLSEIQAPPVSTVTYNNIQFFQYSFNATL